MSERRARRTEVVGVRVTPEELRELQRMAENERMALWEYMRAATFSYMALRGNKLAWKLLGESVLSVLHEAAAKFGQDRPGSKTA
jgi:hypothetical protein